MTRITIDLTDEQMKAVRAHWFDAYLRRCVRLDQVRAAIFDALPPVSIEPKAGGTCRRKGLPNYPSWNIIFVDDSSVVIRAAHHGDWVVQGRTPEAFAELYEVLS